MISRLTFFFIAVFWATMNVLLWRAEYGAHGSDISVPVNLVWRRILTAPDASALTIYQDGKRSGFCEITTSVGTEMAALDGDKPPPEGIIARAGYQIRLNGTASLGDFTNRVRFDARLQFSANREWREINLKVSSRDTTVEIHSSATNQMVALSITTDGATVLRVFNFADLRNPTALLRAFSGNSSDGLLDALDLPVLPPEALVPAQNIHWEAHRARLQAGHEPVSVYRLETRVFDHPVVIYASTLGEILRVELPGGFIATLDDWDKP